MRSVLIRLYPSRWRERYGDEFLAILEERPLGPYDIADILLGAFDARLRSQRAGATHSNERGLSMSLRVGGIAAIVGAVILAVSWFGALSGTLPLDGRVLAGLIILGLVFLLVALTILSAAQARVRPRMVWAAFGLAMIGAVGYTIGLLGLMGVNEGDLPAGSVGVTIAPFAFVVGGLAAVVGFALFGIATYRTGTLSRTGAVLLAVGPASGAVAWLLAMNVSWDLGGTLFLGAMACFLAGWVVLGIAAIRLDRPTTAARPA
jgi:hypothetical protein